MVLSEGRKFFTACAPFHCFGSDVPTVLTSMQEKDEAEPSLRVYEKSSEMGPMCHTIITKTHDKREEAYFSFGFLSTYSGWKPAER
ncbi:hypothetical protein AVEN_79123-1 [Araneus ventricosus]|uniref:Uncharacterized protein n=1 Tax=Araneus ventricosus TaxID=182803 RepID=A0A4Y2MA78_ARAVE|nr:hypothetical protein AVEN_79123-1 [Araneus ventricosus]